MSDDRNRSKHAADELRYLLYSHDCYLKQQELDSLKQRFHDYTAT